MRLGNLRYKFRQEVFVEQVYGEMQRVDRGLRSEGNSESVEFRNISDKLELMFDFLEQQYQSHLKSRSNFTVDRFYDNHPFWFWLIDRVWPYLAGISPAFLFKKPISEG